MFIKTLVNLNSRTAPDLKGSIVNTFFAGTIIEIDPVYEKEADNYLWRKVKGNDVFIAEKSLNGENVFISYDVSTDDMVTATVIIDTLNIRDEPSTSGNIVNQAKRGDKIQITAKPIVMPNKRYHWRQTVGGFVAEFDTRTNIFYLQTIDEPPPATRPREEYVVTAPILNVRSEPIIDPVTLLPNLNKNRGEHIFLYTDNVFDDGEYIWREHPEGWSAEQSLVDKEAYMVEAGAILPGPDWMFKRLPLNISHQKWMYYYGNTVFAYIYGGYYNYNGYSQGLHGGVDFGNYGGAPVYAGVQGIFDGPHGAFGPNRLDVIVNNYRIIYGHLAKPRQYPIGTTIYPDTILGEIDYSQQHLHIEIRKGGLLFNPFSFMPESMQQTLFTNFPAEGSYSFFQNSIWRKWITPLDQPTIILGGPIIGPKA